MGQGAAKGGSEDLKSGCESGYWRLEKRLGGFFGGHRPIQGLLRADRVGWQG